MSVIYKVIKFNLHEKWHKLIGEESDVCCLFMESDSILFHYGFNNDYGRNHKSPPRCTSLLLTIATCNYEVGKINITLFFYHSPTSHLEEITLRIRINFP